MNILFCNGQPKSGSTFFFALASRLVDHRPLDATIAACPGLAAIVHYNDGRASGFVRGTVAAAAAALAALPGPATDTLIVKIHDADPPAAGALPVPAMICTTFRDPTDVMVALRDQGLRERAKAPGQVRKAFLGTAEYNTALTHTTTFLARLTASFSPDNWYFEYPAFIRPSPPAAAVLARALHTDEQRVATVAAELDRDIRSGAVWGEFNRGEVGRGQGIIDGLVRDGLVPADLARHAAAAHRQLVSLVRRHGCGITAG